MNPSHLEMRSFHCAGRDFIPDVGSMEGAGFIYIYIYTLWGMVLIRGLGVKP